MDTNARKRLSLSFVLEIFSEEFNNKNTIIIIKMSNSAAANSQSPW